MEEYEVIVIGGGPAGLSAALYTARAQKSTLVLDKRGQGAIKKVDKLDNYLGFPQGTTGKEFMELSTEQVKRFGAEIRFQEALSIKPDMENQGYLVETAEGEYRGKALVLATGVKHEKPKVKNIEKFEGMGISYCVTCDGFFFKDAKVAVLGSKDYAAKEALELLNYTDKVTLLADGKDIEIRDSLKKEVEESNIEIVEEKVEEVLGNKVVEGIKLKSGEEKEFKGIFVAVGTSGATDFARTLGIQVEGSTIKVDPNNSTGLPLIYAAGDCTGGNKQVAIAVGQGANAGINLISELKGSKHVDYH